MTELAEIRERWAGNVDSHWWCPSCKRPVDCRCVTFTEQHDLCGSNVVWVDGQEMSSDISALLAEIDRQAAVIREQAAEIERFKEQRENMINALAESSYCCENHPCPEDYVKVGCKGCLSRYFGVDMTA